MHLSITFATLFLLSFVLAVSSKHVRRNCDVYQGNWVYDKTYPLYDPLSCPFISQEYNCKRYGRPDSDYLKYRWQPQNCEIPRFNGKKLLKKLKGKKIMFVGDTLNHNFYDSLVCLLHAAVPNSNITIYSNDKYSTTNFQDYKVQVIKSSNNFLVDLVLEPIGRVLKLDLVKEGDVWKGMDVLIFQTHDWWLRKGKNKPWDYIQEGDTVLEDMNRTIAFSKALLTWAKWVNSDIDRVKTKVYFQGMTPKYDSDRHLPGNTCGNEIEPFRDLADAGSLPSLLPIMNDALSTITKPIQLLNLTTLSMLRKDGHPSLYNYNGTRRMDCTHWCVPGVPDTWSQLLYVSLMQ